MSQDIGGLVLARQVAPTEGPVLTARASRPGDSGPWGSAWALEGVAMRMPTHPACTPSGHQSGPSSDSPMGSP